MPLQSWGATVTHIVDGDTFDVIWDDGYLPPQDLPNRIRVAGVDTNEKTLNQPFSNEATLRLAELLPIGTRVILQAQDENSSSLGRPVRHVLVDGVNIATILIQEGLGLAVSYEFESDYRDEYFAASEIARIAEAGMWEPGASGGDPSTWPDMLMYVNFDAAGDDFLNLNDEYVHIQNNGPQDLDLTGWTIRLDGKSSTIALPATVLNPGEYFRIYVGSGVDTANSMYLGNNTPLFINGGDVLYLRDEHLNIRGHQFWPTTTLDGPMASIVIDDVQFDSPGADDATNPNGEFVVIRNAGPTAVDLSGWRLKDDSNDYIFKDGEVLQAGETLRIFIGSGVDSDGVRYWGNTTGILNNDFGTLEIWSPRSHAVDAYSWGPETTEGESPRGAIRMVAHFDGEGASPDSPNEEWVALHNTSDSAIDLSGYRLVSGGVTYTFADGFTLAANTNIRVMVGSGTDTATTLFWGNPAAIFNDSNGLVDLIDESDITILRHQWPNPESDVTDYGIVIDRVLPGDGSGDPAGEFLTIRNASSAIQNLANWQLSVGDRQFVFLEDRPLNPGDVITIRMGTGVNTADTLYWGSATSVLPASGNLAVHLRSPIGDLVESHSWGTATSPAQSVGAAIELTINYDATGIDEDNPNGEWINIVNVSSQVVSLNGYQIYTDGTAYTFDAGDVLAAGARMRIYLGNGVDTGLDRYANGTLNPFPNDTDDVELRRTDTGGVVSRFEYPFTGTPLFGAQLAITAVNYDVPGSDDANPNGEWIEITNTGSSTAQLRDWRLQYQIGTFYDFADTATLAAGQTLRLHVGIGVDTATALFWGFDRALLSNTAGNLILQTPYRQTADTFNWSSTPADGGDGDDFITGSTNSDTIRGNAGNDTIQGGSLGDLLNGDDGADRLLGESGDDTLIGGAGDDHLDGSSGADSIEGGEGADSIIGDSGADLVYGGTENDTVTGGTSDDTIYGGANNDLIYGDDQNDSLFGDEGADTIYGGTFDDVIDGGSEDDQLFGESGSDSVRGGLGNDTIDGGSGGDTLHGDEGADSLVGDSSEDLIYGGADADTIQGGTANDTIYGGTHRDLIYGDDQNDSLLGDSSSDTIYGGTFDDFIDGGSSGDSLFGDSGSDTIRGGTSGDTIDGGSGTDTLYGDSGSDSILGDSAEDLIYGGSGNDTIYGGTSNDTVYGGTYRDRIYGDDQNDSLFGGSSSDTIYGGTFDDFIDGGSSGDSLFGDSGSDTIRGGTSGDTIDGGSGTDTLYGDSGSDSILGDSAEDLIYGGSGNDTIYGGTSNDTVYGGTYRDRIYGDDQNDSLFGGSSSDTIYGGTFDDFIDGGSSADSLYGGSGSDTIAGGSNNDRVFGGTGHDSIRGGTGHDTVLGGDNNDTIHGEDGNDSLLGEGSSDTITGGLGDDFIDGGSSADLLNGDDGNDSILGDSSADLIYGGADNDTVFGGTANDTIYGGTHNDLIHGDDQNDSLLGDSGSDTIYGGSFDDFIDGGSAADVLFGDSGSDTIIGGSNNDMITGGTGNDSLTGGTGDDTVDGSESDDTIRGEDGNDSLLGGSGSDTIFGGLGDDIIDGGSSSDRINGDEGNDSIVGGSSADLIYGGTENDTIQGGTSNDTIYGGSDSDLIHGEDQNDSLFGGSSSDTVYGGLGDDTLDGGSSADRLYGGSGADSILGDSSNDLIYGGSEEDTIDGGTGNDTIFGGTSADVITGDEGDDLLHGDSSSDTINGGLGNDTILAGTGHDVVDGGDGADSIEGGTGRDSIDGGLMDDVLKGEADNDTLLGGDGNDTLIGGDGDDVLTGGAGLDVFVFDGALLASIDTIADYTVGEDRLHLADEVFTGLAAGALAASAFGANDAGQATTADQRLIYETDTGALYFDADGSGATGRVQIASLAPGLALTHEDFFVI